MLKQSSQTLPFDFFHKCEQQDFFCLFFRFVVILLLQPPQCWHHRSAPPCPVLGLAWCTWDSGAGIACSISDRTWDLVFQEGAYATELLPQPEQWDFLQLCIECKVYRQEIILKAALSCLIKIGSGDSVQWQSIRQQVGGSDNPYSNRSTSIKAESKEVSLIHKLMWVLSKGIN